MKRSSFLAILLLVTAELVLGGLLYHHYREELDQRLQFHSAELNTGFTTLVDSYRQVVEAIFEQAVRQPEIIDLLAEANSATPRQRNKMRGRLYRKLYPLYRLLRERDIRVLQFVLADGTSFLRFNRPDLYGDDVAGDRPTLEAALRQNHAAQAFENGRVYPGFRYSFPLVKDSRVVGVADFSAAFDALHRILLKREPNTGAFKQFLIRRDLMEAVAHPTALHLFIDSPIHAAYVTEDPASDLRHVSWSSTIPGYIESMNTALAANADVQNLITRGREGGVFQCLLEEECYAVSLKPVTDSLNRAAGFIVSSRPSEEYAVIRTHHLLAFLLGSLLLIGGGTAFRRWLASRQRLEIISRNMAEGMYVMNTQGRVLYANPVACELLGYTQGELKGQVAHDLFHLHSDELAIDADNCPIRLLPLSGVNYQGDNENFLRKDGREVRVSVTSSPLVEEGEITGSVVLFRDIGAEYKNRMRLQQSDIAFRNLAEAVLVTDADAKIQAVNPAFCEITGYSEKEVLGKNPRILSSGRHDTDFYREMWRTIHQLGSWQGEIWNRRKDGEVFPERLSISAIRDDQDRVVSYVSVFSDITDILSKEERLRELAFHDQLTRLPNRTAFHDLFEHALQRAKRRERRLALIFLDLDRFKKINDTLGHLVGDRLLQAVARRLRDIVREEDVVARIGGDEFTILLDDIGQDDAPARVARKLLEVLCQPIQIEQKSLYISASIGISIYPQDGRNTVDLLRNADAAMYLSKQEGYNSYSYFTQSMAREAEERFALENDLRDAIGDDQFRLFYQPKVQVEDGAIVGLEALLRWQHPERGLLTPNRFLEVASDAGLLPEITEWVVREAARQIGIWRKLGLKPGRIAVNVDDHTFRVPNMIEKLDQWLRMEGAGPGDLELEIVETVILQQRDSGFLWQKLADAGFHLSIDDFGTGESSLFRLKQLPVKTLKVDKAFVDDIDREESDRAVMRSIVSMAKSLGKRVLAEGVERESQLEVLRQEGCEQIQGYLTGKPQPAESITPVLRAAEDATRARKGEDEEHSPRIH